MTRKVTIDPITRIEGHARIEVDIDDDNQVTNSVFKVMDFRGWETFLLGTPVEMMPSITPRICGTCSVTHHLASAKAVDNVFGVTPPQTAVLLRYALNLAGYIHSHAIHIFALAGPDLLLGLDADPAKRNIVGLIEAAPELAKKALELRAFSTQVTEMIGGRGIHPVTAVAGGMSTSLDKSKRAGLLEQAKNAVEVAKELLLTIKQPLMSRTNHIHTLPLPTHYLGLVNNGLLDHYQGDLRLRSPDGSSFEFPCDEWTSYLFEETVPASYAKFVFCRTGEEEAVPYRVGPLARINCCDQIDTPLANAELEEFRGQCEFPCHQTVMYHYARLIELLYATEKLTQLFADDELWSKEVRTLPDDNPQNASGIVEAPRGVLIHDYEVDTNGILTGVNLLVATQQNVPAINATVGMSAQAYLDEADDERLLNGIEFGVRCYDPCLSCATHRIGEMKLEVVVRQQGKVIRTARR